MSFQETFNSAARLHQSGQLAEAKELYRQVLAQNPDHAGALAMTGLIALQTADPAGAIDLLERAVAAEPTQALYQGYLGQALAAQGALERAIAAYRRAVHLQPNLGHVQFNLGNALNRLGRTAPAVAADRRAAELQPTSPEVHNNLGVALDTLGEADAAVATLLKAIELPPGYADAHINLGSAFAHKRDWASAVASFDEALRLKPGHADTLFKRALALRDAGQWEATIKACRELLEISPHHTDVEMIIGQSLLAMDRPNEAIATYRQILSRAVDSAQPLNSLGIALLSTGDCDAAMAAFDAARTADPNDAASQWNYGLELLRRGDWERGWPGYRWRWRRGDWAKSGPLRPRWDGSELNGRPIVIYGEQGYGDTFQFIRYVPLVAARGGKIILSCHPHLQRVLSSIEPVDCWVRPGDPVPEHTVQCPLMDLPEVMKTTLANVPATVPYLRAETALSEQWRARLAADARRKIGLVWANKASPPGRFPPVEALGPLAEVGGVRFFSLQKWRSDMTRTTPTVELTDWTDELNDFADTAALIDNLDLVITVDTAVAHVAGALGKPVWVLLKFLADWRWMLHRTDSPWYPTMRLFRQSRPGDWDGTVRDVVEALRML